MAFEVEVWNDHKITFATEESNLSGVQIPRGYVNATQMCQAGNKSYTDWFRLDKTQEFLRFAAKIMNTPIHALVIGIKYGVNENRGTWLHPRVANNLARWISPEFDFWVSSKIQELITIGQTKLVQADVLIVQETLKIDADELEALKLAVSLAEKLDDRAQMQALLIRLNKVLGIADKLEEKKVGIKPQKVKTVVILSELDQEIAKAFQSGYYITDNCKDFVSDSELFIYFKRLNLTDGMTRQTFLRKIKPLILDSEWSGVHKQSSRGDRGYTNLKQKSN